MKRISTLGLFVFLSLFSFSQTSTEFWFAPPEVTSGHGGPNGDQPINLRLATGATASTVTIDQPALGAAAFGGAGSLVYVIPPNSQVTVDLSPYIADLETQPSDVVLSTGLHIVGTTPITAYYELNTNFNPEIFALKGANGLGLEFYTPFNTRWRNGVYTPTPYTSFDIVATEDNTTVLVYPRVGLDGGHPPLTSYSITLMRGETYSGSVTSTLGSDNPAGTAIVADKPIAVSVKDDSAWPQPWGGCRDLMGDQLVPVNIIGNEYIVSKGFLNANIERVFITAVDNGTEVSVDGVVIANLFAGETFDYQIDNPFAYITATNPVYVMHISGFGCEMGAAILPPLNCAGSDQISFVRSQADPRLFGLSVLVRTGSEGDFFIDGDPTLLQATDFTPVPFTGGAWMGALVTYTDAEIAAGVAHQITNTSDVFAMGIINGGASTGCRFGYFSEFSAQITTDAGPDQIVCANDSVDLNGSVIGGSTTGIWTTSGSGIFLPDDITLNATYEPSFTDLATGFVNLTLTSTGACFPISDIMTVTFTPAPTVDAGADVMACSNNADVVLAGVVTVATGGVWSGGAGTFTPSNTDLNAVYSPTAAEISAGNVTLTLTSTGNGTCNEESDDMIITFTPAPTADAGPDQSVCANNPDASLSGGITIATGGIWSGGGGSFNPNTTALNAVYTPSAAEILAGSVTLTLTTTGNGNCTAVSDNVTITINAAPSANAGPDLILCSNNADVNLSGSVLIATGGQWTGGLGLFNPSNNDLNATYTPTAGEVASGTLTLTLTTTGNGNCNPESDDITITFTGGPTVDAGADVNVCANNADVNLAGAVTVATGGVWTGGGGTFVPSNTDLNAVYSPSAAEISAGTVTLTLTSTGNGSCLPESDDMVITIAPVPVANAGPDATSCANNPNVALAGVVTNAGGGIWSGGGGTYIPAATDLNATYVPSAAEIMAGTVTLTLTTTGNGNCSAVADNMVVTITPSPIADAGADQIACANNADVVLNGSVVNAAGGQWSGGLGLYTPSANALNATYSPTAGELLAGSVTLTLTTTGNGTCNPESDDMVITFTTAPTADAGPDLNSCANNPDVSLAGSVTIASGGIWSGGTGSFSPSNTDLNATYTPSAAEIAAGTVTLTLTTTGNGTCNPEMDDVVITIDPVPVVDAGADQVICVDNLNVILSGSVSGITNTGIWTTSGSGIFVPNATTLSATYVASSADSIAGTVTLTLTSTNNGTCLPIVDNMVITILPAGIAAAGSDVSVCANNSAVVLNGSVSGGATTGTWTTTGTGVFTPSASDLNATYIPSAADAAAGTVTLTLTANSCNAATDNLTITITPEPVVDAGLDQTVCASNLDIVLSGSVSGASNTGIWTTTGTGVFTPSATDLNATYTASSADSIAQGVTIVLEATGIGSCLTVTDTVHINIFPTGGADAGPDQILCANNADVLLAGVITGGASEGVWTTSGSGTFVPADTALNATYVPSAADIATGTISLILSATNSCNPASDFMVVTITPAPVVDAGPDQSICGTNPTLVLSGSVSGASGVVWSSSGTGGFAPNTTDLNVTYTASAADIAAGSITIYLTSTGNGNCNAEVDSLIVSISSGVVVDAGIDQNVCSTAGFTVLTGNVSNGSSTGVWTTLGTGTFTPNDSVLTAEYNFSNADTTAGSVTLVLTSTNNGSCAVESDTVVITFGSSAFASAGADQMVCADNMSVNLNGFVSGGSSTGQWTTLGSGNFAPNDSILAAVYLPSSTDSIVGSVEIVLTTTNNGSCAAGQDTMLITIEPVPLVNAGNDQLVCSATDSVFIGGTIANAPGSIWTTTGTGVFVPSDTLANAVYAPSALDLSIGSWQLILTSAGSVACTAVSDTLTIDVVTPFIPGFEFIETCVDQPMSFTDTTVVYTGTITAYTWYFGDGNTSTAQNPVNIYDSPGIYDVTLVVESSLGCIDSITQSIVVNDRPTAGFNISGDFNVETAMQFTDASGGAVSWSWDFGDGLGGSTDQDPQYTYLTGGTYTIEQVVTSAFGCTDTAYATIEISDELIYPPVLPSGFTPNGDGENDILIVRGGPFETVNLKVYNNWGNLMFESDAADEGWDGTWKGVMQPDEDYIYTIYAVTIDGTEYRQSGSVAIIR